MEVGEAAGRGGGSEYLRRAVGDDGRVSEEHGASDPRAAGGSGAFGPDRGAAVDEVSALSLDPIFSFPLFSS